MLKINKRILLALVLAGIVLIASLSVFKISNNNITPIYITLSGHIEDGGSYENCANYPASRDKFIVFAEFIEKQNVPFNLQIDYEYLDYVYRCDISKIQSDTGNTNLVDYLANEYNFEIDAHQGGGYEVPGEENYADVRYTGGIVTDAITETVGGIIWNDVRQFSRLSSGEQGILFSEFTWYPEIITMGVHSKHHDGDFSLDDKTSGIWKPMDFGGDFLKHDQDSNLIYVGPGNIDPNFSGRPGLDSANDIDYIQTLVDGLESGKLEGNKIYTATIGIPQKIMTSEEGYRELEAEINKLKRLASEGKVVIISFEDVVEVWKNKYNSEPSILTFEEFEAL